ncbi:MAG: LysR family transcriptional regulator [Enterocloster asparagiformis]|nr:LysR family transcriptional regulator [Enterocloster asparagiformis]
MDLKYLNYILAIASEETISKAAKKLYISQPNLSMYLAKLEKEVGVPLFWRSENRYIPTSAGKQYIEAARNILEISDATDFSLNEHRELRKGVVRIGMAADVQRSLIPSVLPLWRQIFPGYCFKLSEISAQHAQSMLIKKQIDLAVYQGGEIRRELRYRPLTREDFLVVVPKTFGLSGYGEMVENIVHPYLPIRYLEKLPIVMQSGGRLRERAERVFYANGIKPNVVVETGSVISANKLSNAGVGCSFITNMVSILDQRDLCYTDIFSMEPRVLDDVWIMNCVYAPENYLKPVLERMTEVCYQKLCEFLPRQIMC